MFVRIAELLGLHGKAALPLEVSEAIEAARILVRDHDPEDGAPRVFVALGGGSVTGAFYFDRESARERVLRRWPELSERQVSRAVAFIESRVSVASRSKDAPQRKNWVTKFSD